jgi:hypothetical protein
MSSSATDLMYTIRGIPGTGKGLFATRMISMGTRILSEEPIIRVPEAAPDTQVLRASISRQVNVLTPGQRQAFLSMGNIYNVDGASRYQGIIRTNALPFGDGVGEVGIFLNASRINHACDNNAQENWNENINRHTVHAKRDIEIGEEITIFYLGVLNNRKTRQGALRSKFKITCSCRLCSLPPDQSQESDRRLDEILKLDGLIGRDGIMGIMSAPLRILQYVDQQIRLYNEQGPNDSALPRAFIEAAKVVIGNGDLARARIFVERAVFAWIVLRGDDDSQALQYRAFSQDPSKHDLYGLSMKWKTDVDDVPQGLNSKEFEDWLWRREKPIQPEQPVLGTDPISKPNLKLFSVLPVPDKGKGLVARFNIRKGKRILSEKPLFTTSNWSSTSLLETGLTAKLKALSKAEQRQFLSLHNNFPGKHPFSGIVKTNALPCGPNSTIGGVYPTICLINHSCLPNAHHSWNSDTKCETIHAIRLIKKGEEITISYDKGGPSISRRAYLKDAFGFDCNCRLCMLPPADLQASDARRRQIKLLDNAIGDRERMMKKPEESLADCLSLLRILNDEYKGSAGALIPRLYYNAFQISISHGDQARARAFAERGYKWRVICEGEDSPETRRTKSLKESPDGHSSFGASDRWKTSKGSIPKGLDKSRFEAWLWRKGR